MNLIFDTELSKLTIKSSNKYGENNYILVVNLTFVHYHYDEDDDFEQRSRLDGYLKNLLKTHYSSIEITDSSESNSIEFKENFIEISSRMNQEKLLKIYESLKDKEIKTKFLRINLSSEELKLLFVKEEFNGNITLWNTFDDVSFEFQYE
jgi:hypothetical protein